MEFVQNDEQVELFVNQAWTSAAKVPAESPFGVRLIFGTNAFASLKDAIAYAQDSGLENPIFYDGDSKVAIDVKKFTEKGGTVPAILRSQEIKATLTEKETDEMEKKGKASFSGKGESKIAPKGALEVTETNGETAMEIAGFKDVTISRKKGEEEGGAFTVAGGNSQIQHTFDMAETLNKTTYTYKGKEVATVNGKADGNLTVTGATVATTGAYGAVEGDNCDGISSDDAFFTIQRPGEPSELDWGEAIVEGSTLDKLPAFANVTLEKGATAAELAGGTVELSRSMEKNETESADRYTEQLTKNISYKQAATGTLKAIESTVGAAVGYANVTISGAGADFASLQAGTSSGSAKTTFNLNETETAVSRKTTSTESFSLNANGNLTVEDIGLEVEGGSASGYSKVTLNKKAKVGDLAAGNYSYSASSSSDYSASSSGDKLTSSYSGTSTTTAAGTLTTGKSAKVEIGNVIGFSNITLTNATVAGINAGEDARSIPAAGFFPATEKYSGTASYVDDDLRQSKYTENQTAAAAGNATLTDSEVGGINGIATVKLTNTAVTGSLAAGKSNSDASETYSASIDAKTEIRTENAAGQVKENTNALGTLTVTKGSFADAAISDFATVTIQKATGSIAQIEGGYNYSYSNSANSTTVDGVDTLVNTASSESNNATGSVTVDADDLIIGGISGYSTVKLTGAAVEGDIDASGYKKSSSYKTTYNTNSGVATLSSASSDEGIVASTITVKNAAVGGGIKGFKSVTLDNADVAGGIGTYATTSSKNLSQESSEEVELTKQSFNYSYADTPAVALTLKNGAAVGGELSGIKSLSLEDDTAVGDLDMTGEKFQLTESISYDAKKELYTEKAQLTMNRTATGSVTGTEVTVGAVIGASKVTVKNSADLGANDDGVSVDGFATASTEKVTRVGESLVADFWQEGVYAVDQESAVSYDTYMSASVTAGATVTLTDTGAAGIIQGASNVKLENGAIAGAAAYVSKTITSATVSAGLEAGSTNETVNAVGAFVATDAEVAGDVTGYQTITLDAANVAGMVGGIVDDAEEDEGANGFGQKTNAVSFKYTSSTDDEDLVTGQQFSSNSTQAPTATLTLKNGAVVAGGAVGVKTLNVNKSEINGDVDMAAYSVKATDNITYDSKSRLYTQTAQYSSTGVAVGAATVTSATGPIGSLSGVANVKVSDSEKIGGLFAYNYSENTKWTMKGETLDDAVFVGPRYTLAGDETVTELSESCNSSYNVVGAVTLNNVEEVGAIEGFANVTLTDVDSVGDLTAGASKGTSTGTFKGKKATIERTDSSGVAGTLTATDVDFLDGAQITGFATVKLTDAEMVGDEGGILIAGGSIETTAKGTGTGANFVEAYEAAETDAEENAKTTYKAMGNLTIVDSELAGSEIVNFATVTVTDSEVGSIYAYENNVAKAAVTFNGENYVLSVEYINDLTVKGGETAIGSYLGTEGNDTVTVNGGTALTVTAAIEFNGGDDKAVVNGVVRAVGGIEPVTGKLAISGSGAIAVTDEKYAEVKALENVKVSGSVELINAGSAEAIVGIRTRKEELADNKAGGARKLMVADGDDAQMNGWLSGVEDAANGQFADTEDWISFKYQAGYSYGVDLLSDAEKFTVELCQAGKTIQMWQDEASIAIDTTKLTAGTEYQFRLTTEKDQAAFAYAVTALA